MPSTLGEVAAALISNGIVGPPFAPAGFVPTVLVDIVFEGKGSVNLGDFFTPGEAKNEPSISFIADPLHPDATYTVSAWV